MSTTDKPRSLNFFLKCDMVDDIVDDVVDIVKSEFLVLDLITLYPLVTSVSLLHWSLLMICSG